MHNSLLSQNESETTSIPNKEIDAGALIVNADDWGRDQRTTGRIFDCVNAGALSSVSAMVFMSDSQRSAAIALDRKIDAGLHLNFTTPFSDPHTPTRLVQEQGRLLRYLRSSRFSQAVFHPGLARSFQYVLTAQIEEFSQLYGGPPRRIDGHHHMHLCANVLWGKLLPSGVITRRNFTFLAGEKGTVNRLYRKFSDQMLARRHPLTDCFFSLIPLDSTERLQRIFSLARHSIVEVACHPANEREHKFLTSDEKLKSLDGAQIASGFTAHYSRA